jgi:predicted membrane-bound dolichyl-phosphate-mannose-protein mannosyltransferase
VRWAGGSRWLALGAATLMAFDNLMIVQGRIGTLDIYVVTAMVWSVALYLRGRPLLAGLAAGIGACMKLFALDVVFVLLIYELLRWRAPPVKVRIRSVAVAVVATAGSFLGLLAVLDQIAPPYDNSAGRFVGDNPFSHLSHMITYAAQQAGSLSGFSSYPWQWLVDYRPIVYLSINPAQPLIGAPSAHPAVHFLGFISPPILLAGLLGTAAALWLVLLAPVARRWRGKGDGRLAVSEPTLVEPERNLLNVSVAWFLGTFGPFLIASLAFNRTTYLFYMMIVMPGFYLAGAWLVRRLRRHLWLVTAWAVCVVAAAVLLYPFTPLP